VPLAKKTFRSRRMFPESVAAEFAALGCEIGRLAAEANAD